MWMQKNVTKSEEKKLTNSIKLDLLCCTLIPLLFIKRYTRSIINRPGVAGAVLQTPSSLIHLFILIHNSPELLESLNLLGEGPPFLTYYL